MTKRNNQKKYHVIYKTTCIITDRYYIGMHSTDNLDDKYLGSGKRLGYSLNKYGKENHRFEILEHHDNREALRKREAELVNVDTIKDLMCMNLTVGGRGSEGYAIPEETKKRISNSLKNHVISEETKQRLSLSQKGKPRKKHTEETKSRIAEKMKGRSPWSKDPTLIMARKKAMSDSHKGKPNGWLGRKHSPETIKLLKEIRQTKRLSIIV